MNMMLGNTFLALANKISQDTAKYCNFMEIV